MFPTFYGGFSLLLFLFFFLTIYDNPLYTIFSRMIQLLWTPIADEVRAKLKKEVSESPFLSHPDNYIAIIYCGENPASATYVRMKKKFAKSIGLRLKVFGQDPVIENKTELLALANSLTQDPHCLGFMPQLPLPEYLKEAQFDLFDHIPRYKDIDGLGSQFMGKYITNQLDVLGATPQAVMTLLDHYGFGVLRGKTVSIIGQSNLLGKPLVLACMRRGASVLSFNSKTDRDFLRQCCLQSDIVISCTGVVHLIDQSYFRTDKTQVAIDVGRGSLDGKPVGDMTLETIAPQVAAYTPIPWGVGPLTIASLLANAIILSQNNHK